MKKTTLALLGLALAWSTSSQASLISSGNAEIPGTFSFNFETGSNASFSSGVDIFWNQLTATTRELEPSFYGSAQLLALGATPFASITEADLLAYAYTTAAIAGPPGGSLLDVGNTFAVLTSEGNYAKVEVTGYDNGIADRDYYDLHFRYELFDGVATPTSPLSVPEPGSLALMAAGLAGLATLRRRINAAASGQP